MTITLEPIGVVHTDAQRVPRHWTVSEVEGTLVLQDGLIEGLRSIEPGQRIVVLFHFDRSPPFDAAHLSQRPPNAAEDRGVFSICSPIRPNPIGMSVLEVLEIQAATIRVKGVDMLDGTPILDIKPHVVDAESCPSGPRPDRPDRR